MKLSLAYRASLVALCAAAASCSRDEPASESRDRVASGETIYANM